MTHRDAMNTESIDLIQRADSDTLGFTLKLLKLGASSPGFNAALKKATTPGEEVPPIAVIKALVNEWARKEGL